MFPISMAPGPHSSISEGFLHSIILRPKKPLGSWNLVNPLLSVNEAWMDECAVRLQLLVDQYKLIQHQIFAIEKFRYLIVTFRSCPGVKKIFLKKRLYYQYLSQSYLLYILTYYISINTPQLLYILVNPYLHIS